ncbi:MAG TPA: hypothetical protein VKB69_12860 [Micromonosporaceae bacterium]|nr:hypothetical protein [Micromonosporaceae bacterium]
MTTPDALEPQFTLLTAVARYELLRTRDALAPRGGDPTDETDGSDAEPGDPQAVPLGRAEALELLALSEVIIRKAGYGRQLAVRTARSAGASWSQVGAALGTTKQSAWETHLRWVDEQASAPIVPA